MSIDNAMAAGRSRCPLPVAALAMLAIGLIGARANAQLPPAAAFASPPVHGVAVDFPRRDTRPTGGR
jgi:hypothetical protein